jgi:hypothetical protein
MQLVARPQQATCVVLSLIFSLSILVPEAPSLNPLCLPNPKVGLEVPPLTA